MKGLIFRSVGSLANLKVEELPMPARKAGEVLVQVVAAAINPSDVKNVLGKMSQTTLPRVPGRDFAGRVVSGDSHWQGKSVCSEPEGISASEEMEATPNLWLFLQKRS